MTECATFPAFRRFAPSDRFKAGGLSMAGKDGHVPAGPRNDVG